MTNRDQEKPMNDEWFRRMAEFESTCESTSVGGFAHDLGMLRRPDDAVGLRKTALGRLIELARRNAGLSLEDLAKRARVELSDLVELECGEPDTVEPRTIQCLCEALELPKEGVMELAGLTQVRDSSLGHAAVRFAAHAKGIERLTREERQALEEFVKDLAKSSDPK